MTEEEKKEFEEFLQWKKEKAAKEQQAIESETSAPQEATNAESGKTSQNNHRAPQNTDAESKMSGGLVVITLCVVLFIILLFILLSKSNKNTPEASYAEVEEVEVDSIVAVVDDVAIEPRKVEWDFTISTDAMTDTKNIWAVITSDDYIIQDFPYEGLTFAKLTVRYMKKYGYDVIVEITKGQINGRSYNGTNYITARFDEGIPKKYYFNEAADGSPEYVFLNNKQDFIKQCKQAKDIKIDIPVYQSGRPVFSFHVDEPLTWREE
jgi:hypothetical protein